MNRMTVYNWRIGKSIPKVEKLKKAKEAGLDISDYKKIAIDWHLKQVNKINEL